MDPLDRDLLAFEKEARKAWERDAPRRAIKEQIQAVAAYPKTVIAEELAFLRGLQCALNLVKKRTFEVRCAQTLAEKAEAENSRRLNMEVSVVLGMLATAYRRWNPKKRGKP